MRGVLTLAGKTAPVPPLAALPALDAAPALLPPVAVFAVGAAGEQALSDALTASTEARATRAWRSPVDGVIWSGR